MRVSERWTARRAGLDPLEVLARRGDEPFALLHGGPETRFTILGEEPLGRLAGPDLGGLEFEREGAAPPILPDFVGQASYEWGTGLEPLVPAAPASPIRVPGFSFALYRRLLVHDRETGLLHEARRSLDGAPPPAFVPDAGLASVLGSGAGRAGRLSTRFAGGTEDEASYKEKVALVRGMIAAGDVYQVNLTRQEEWAYSGDLRELAAALRVANPAPFSAFIAEPGFAVVSASPERLARLREGWLETRPIKGTAPRGADRAEDRSLAEGLLASGKDRAELAMIVDLERNDLSRTCLPGTTRVEAFPLLETYANVHHLVASVRGRLDPARGLGGLLSALFPGGSITGCPKIAAMRAIRGLEPWPRSVYTGSVGWFSADLSGLDLDIAIRTVWADGNRLRFGVGGAVVWDSDPAAEYLETIHKARSISACLNSARG